MAFSVQDGTNRESFMTGEVFEGSRQRGIPSTLILWCDMLSPWAFSPRFTKYLSLSSERGLGGFNPPDVWPALGVAALDCKAGYRNACVCESDGESSAEARLQEKHSFRLQKAARIHQTLF